MIGLSTELRLAIRSLRQSRMTTGVAIVALALGIGANSAIFSAINGVFLKPLPYSRPDRLVNIWAREPIGDPRWTVSPVDFLTWQAGSGAFQEMAAFNIDFPVVRDEHQSERLLGSIVTPNFFRTLGVRPAIGADFDSLHGTPGGNRVVVLSHGLWTRRYGADPAIIGSDVRIGEHGHTVIGVMPPEYRHPDPSYQEGTELWRPIAFGEDATDPSRHLRVIGRLRDGATIEQANQELAAIARSLAERLPETHTGWGVTLVPLADQLFGSSRNGLLLLLGAAALMLLIVSTNVANLMLGRSLGRAREFAVRSALGSVRSRLAGQVLMEALILALAGGALGILLVVALGDVIGAISRRYVSPLADVSLDARVVAFSVLVAAITAVLFGLIPALRSSRSDLLTLMGDAARGSSSGRASRTARRALIVSEVVLTTVLLITGSLLVRSFVMLLRVDKGFDDTNVLTFEASLPASRYADQEQAAAFFDGVLATLRELHGVRAASLVSDLPFTGLNMFMEYRLADSPPPSGTSPWAEYHAVAPGYFRTLGIPLLSGRDLSDTDRLGETVNIVINRSLAERLWPGQSALGRRLELGRPGEGATGTVVGVVGDVLDDGLDSSPEPRIYVSNRVAGGRWMTFLVSTTTDPLAIVPSVRSVLAEADASVPLSNVTTLSAVVAETVSQRKAVLRLVATFGTLALMIAALGIYGVLSYTVSERTREIGIRSALGATPIQLRRSVVADALGMVAVGLVGGFALSLLAARMLTALLFRVRPYDPLTFTLVAAALLAVATLASLRPARRATRVDPMSVLRQV